MASPMTVHNWFRARSHDLRMMSQNDDIKIPTIRAAKSELNDLWKEVQKMHEIRPHSILEILNSPEKLPTFQSLGLKTGLTLKERKKALKLPEINPFKTPWTEQLSEYLLDGQKDKTKEAWIYRIGELAEEYGSKRQWYPFFATLTVDENKLDVKKGQYQTNTVTFMTDGRAIKEWVRKMAQISMEASGLNWRQRSEKLRPEYFQYVRVFEKGKSGKHLHCHILFFMREIPAGWKKDPNALNRGEYCTERRCKAAEGYWPYAAPQNRQVLYFRFANDVWTNLGHRWPADAKTGKGIDVMPAIASGGYVGKYLGKEEVPGKRVGAPPNMGMHRIIRFIDEMSLDELETATANIPEYKVKAALQINCPLPWPMFKQRCKNELIRRTFYQQTFEQVVQEPKAVFATMAKKTRHAEKDETEQTLRKKLPVWRLRTREQRHNWFQECLQNEPGVDPAKIEALVNKLIDAFPAQRKTTVGVAGSRAKRCM